MLEATFVRRRGCRDRVYVHRADGTSTGWQFPTYGDSPPHDLCHLVVEQELGLTDGFWGLVDQGVDVVLVDNHATLVRGGKPLRDQAGWDLSGLGEAEAAVAALVGGAVDVEDLARLASGDQPLASGDGARILGADLPPGATPEAVATIAGRLRGLAEQWRTLGDGGAIRLVFSAPPI
jgi:hypothetical protein